MSEKPVSACSTVRLISSLPLSPALLSLRIVECLLLLSCSLSRILSLSLSHAVALFLSPLSLAHTHFLSLSLSLSLTTHTHFLSLTHLVQVALRDAGADHVHRWAVRIARDVGEAVEVATEDRPLKHGWRRIAEATVLAQTAAIRTGHNLSKK